MPDLTQRGRKHRKAQVKARKPWDVVPGRGSSRGSWGGHYVYVPGYTRRGPVCVTWGRKQQLSWAFVDRYADEAYAIVDHVQQGKIEGALDLRRLGRFLDAL